MAQSEEGESRKRSHLGFVIVVDPGQCSLIIYLVLGRERPGPIDGGSSYDRHLTTIASQMMLRDESNLSFDRPSDRHHSQSTDGRLRLSIPTFVASIIRRDE